MSLLLASWPYLPLPLPGMTGPGAPAPAAAPDADDTAESAADDADETAAPAADEAAETADSAAEETDAVPPLLSPPQAAATMPAAITTAAGAVHPLRFMQLPLTGSVSVGSRLLRAPHRPRTRH